MQRNPKRELGGRGLACLVCASEIGSSCSGTAYQKAIEEWGGHQAPDSVAREGRIDPVGDRERGGTLTTVFEGTCLVHCSHHAASSQGFARAYRSAAYHSIDQRAGSVRLDSSAQRNLQQC